MIMVKITVAYENQIFDYINSGLFLILAELSFIIQSSTQASPFIHS
jgi:hypothetical protein